MASKLKSFGKKVVGYPEEPVPVVSVADWGRETFSDPKNFVIDYLRRLFPIIGWITRYNLTWLTGDLIAGITVALVGVPQSMSYALIATLPPQYGLYSSFVGVTLYCFFATSKDVSIGPVAVMSLTTAQIIGHVQSAHPHQWDNPTIATTIAFICGFIVLGFGLLRLGWLVEFIPLPAVCGFMTGSAINIAVGQVPGLMGITGFNTREATYKVIINTLKGLPRTSLDASFGLVGLAFLYAVRITCERLTRRYPRYARPLFFVSILRNAFVIIVLTISAWLYTRHRVVNGKYPIKLLGPVPRGFKNIGSPTIDPKLLTALAPDLPLATIVLLLEHIAISKSFGRINNYKIDPNQELIAIGVTNTLGSVFHAYPATGSFSRSALMSKSGVKTPLAGMFTAIGVIVALYGLTDAFFWIPNAALSAVIIHAVADLVAKPTQVYGFWRVSPLEFIIFIAALLVTIFSTIENGIYTAIVACVALLLLRVAHPRGKFLGKVTVKNAVHNDNDSGQSHAKRAVYVPLHSGGGVMNPYLNVEPPAPGVVIYRFEESFLFPNSSLANSALVDYVKTKTRRGMDMTNVRPRDRQWNDPGPRPGAQMEDDSHKPLLRAIVLDFSGVSHVDTTSIQALVDTREEVERWANGTVDFHFATILSPWIRRALIAGNFGTGAPCPTQEIAAVVSYSGGCKDSSERGDVEQVEVEAPPPVRHDNSSGVYGPNGDFMIDAYTPFFHLDLFAAVTAAEKGLLRLQSLGEGTEPGSDSKAKYV